MYRLQTMHPGRRLHRSVSVQTTLLVDRTQPTTSPRAAEHFRVQARNVESNDPRHCPPEKSAFVVVLPPEVDPATTKFPPLVEHLPSHAVADHRQE